MATSRTSPPVPLADPEAGPDPADRADMLICNSARPSRRTSRTAFTAPPPDPDDPLLGFAPYLHDRPRRNSITPDRQRAFIAALAASGIVTQAAREIGASLEALYKLRVRPGAEGFSAAWEAAIDRGILRLEDCAVELALRGEELPIASGGKLLGTYRKHNYGHIRFMLSQRRGGRFGQAGGAGLEPSAQIPGTPAYQRQREQWRVDYEAEKQRQSDLRFEANERFIEKLNRRIGEKRQEAIDAGLMRVLPDGRAEWLDPEFRRDGVAED